jgi:hypothetical protein
MNARKKFIGIVKGASAEPSFHIPKPPIHEYDGWMALLIISTSRKLIGSPSVRDLTFCGSMFNPRGGQLLVFIPILDALLYFCWRRSSGEFGSSWDCSHHMEVTGLRSYPFSRGPEPLVSRRARRGRAAGEGLATALETGSP